MGERVLWAFRHDLPGESDEQLTDRARNGDKSAFGELYRRHRKAAESTAWCLLRSKSDADDVVSDAFAGVLSALRNGRGPRDNFRGYLLACVRNGCRSRRTPTVLVDESQLERWNPAQEDPERYVEADTVARAFSSLAPRWQHTLWMTEVEQLPPTEVSERLDLTPNAAAALTHRARQAFAEAYLAEHLVAATGKDCRKVAPLLPGYVRNQLRDLQQATVERHVVNCQLCAKAVGDLRDVNASLRSLLPLGPAALGTTAAVSDAVVTGTVATVGGGLSIGLPSTGVLLKGLVAVLLVAPVLSTDSPFSGDDGGDERAVSAAENDAIVEAPTNVEPDEGTRPATTLAAPTTAATTPPTTGADDESESEGGGRPTATVPLTTPTVPVTAPNGIVSTLPSVGAVVDGLLDDAVKPLVAVASEPVVETLDEALAFMGFGSAGETVTLLRSLVPLLDGPLLGPAVDELLELTPIGPGSPLTADSAGPGVTDSVPGDDVSDDETDDGDDGAGLPGESTIPGAVVPRPTTPGAPTVSVPTVTVPTVTIPPITLPVISLPPITAPILDLPPITLPAISLPPITIPDLLG